MKKIIKDNYEYGLLFIITLLLFSSILFSTNTIVGGDTQFHFANSQAFLTKFVSLNSTPKLMPIIGNNFLYATPIFYGTLPHFLTACLGTLFYILKLGKSIVYATKIFYVLIFFLSSTVMFRWIKSVSKDRLAALTGAIFYLTLPFKLWSVFVRDGYAEMFTFLFIPMIFYGLHLLLDKQNKRAFYIFFVLGTSGLILSHLITTTFVFLAGLIYVIYEYKKVFQKENIKSLLLACLMILGLTAYYWIPFLEHLLYGEYRIFTDTGLDLKELFFNSVISIKQLLVPNNVPGQHNFFIPIVLLIAFGYIIVKQILTKEKNREVILSIIIVFVFLLFAMCKPLLQLLPSGIYSIQYIFRLFIVPLIFMCFGASLSLLYIKKIKVKKIVAVVLIISSIFIGYLSIDKVYVTSFNLYSGNLSENGMGWQKEYLPVKAIIWYQSDNFEKRGTEAIILNGNAKIETIKKEFDYYELEITDCTNETMIEYPYYFYLGYKACIETEGKTEKLEVIESSRGLVSVSVDKPGKVILQYEGTTSLKAAYIISFISLFGFLIFILKFRRKEV